MNKIRYGIIGFGSFAERAILPAIRASSNSEVVAIQKRSLDAAREKAHEHGLTHAFDSVKDLVSHTDIDAVFIVSANACHHAETLAAARAGKHVIVEKPMALSTREAQEMIRVCKQHDVKLMVGHMVRLSPAVLRMKELVSSGELGEVTFARSDFFYDGRLSKRVWLMDRATAGGGPVFDVGVHCIDTLRFLLSDEVVSVRSHISPHPTATKTESTASISLQFARGTIGSVFCSYESSMRDSFVEVFGTNGAVSMHGFTRSSLRVDLQTTKGDNDVEAGKCVELFDVPDLYEREVTLFSQSILHGDPVPIPGEEGLANQRVLDEIMKG